MRGSGRRPARILLGAAIGLVLAFLSGELALRWLLFAPSARTLGASLRKPHVYADRQSDAYWKLQHLFLDPRERRPAPVPDARLGWRGGRRADPERDRGRVGGGRGDDPNARQLVLLYGDSFAQGNTPPEESFEAILAGSDLASDHELENLGVGGYGLDQIWLSLEETLDDYAARDPIVVVSLMVEDDLDRCALSFRGWPKPRLELREDELALDRPVETDLERDLALHPVGIPSYLLAALSHELPFLPPRVRSWTHRPERTQAELARLCARILERIERELASRGLRHFLYLFHAESGIAGVPPGASWQEPFVREQARALGTPLLSSRPYLLAASPRRGGAGRFYGGARELDGHLNGAGNLVAFEGLRQGIRGELGREDTSRAAARFRAPAFASAFDEAPGRLARGVRLVLDEVAEVDAGAGRVRCSGELADPEEPGGAPRWRLELAREPGRAIRVRWPAPPAGGTLRGRVRASGEGQDEPGLRIRSAAAEVLVATSRAAAATLAVPLGGASGNGTAPGALEIELAAGPADLVVTLEALRFE